MKAPVRGVFTRESAYRAGRSARAVLGQQLDPAAHGEGHGAAVLGILEHQLALIGPPLIAVVVLGGEGVHAIHVAALLVAVGRLDGLSDGGVGGVAAHVLAPGGEAVLGAGHVSDEGAGGPGQGRVVGDEQIVAVAEAADAGVAVLISGHVHVVHGDGGGLLNGAELGVHQQAELIRGGLVDQRVADGAVIGLGVVALDPQLDPRQSVLAVLTKAQIAGLGSHGVDGGLEVGLLVGGQRVKRLLQPAGVSILREHVQEVLAHDLGVDVHVQAVLALGHEVPAVVIGLGAGVVVHKDLVQGLQGQEAGVRVGGGAVGVGPVLGDEGIQHAGLDHLALDLVAVLDQGHGIGAGGLERVGGELIEDLVVLGLLPVVLHVIAGVDGLQILDEQRQSGLAAAGVAHAVERGAVGFLDGLLGQLLQRHALGLGDDLLGGGQLGGRLGRSGGAGAGSGTGACGGSAGAAAAGQQGRRHGEGQRQCKKPLLHRVMSSSKTFFGVA